MKKVFYLLVFLVGTLGNLSAQMVLFEGTFEEAEEKAKEEKKDLFVDFYADWCGPCKAMASEVFTRPEVGEYFNAHFICLQVNVEAKENANLAKTYRVIALPTMVFIRSGKELRRIEGVKAPEAFIKEAKIALGEELSFDQLYDKFKKDKKNFELQQQLLLDAPVFMSSLQGYDREKWASRIESLFPDYLKNKKLENMVNEQDFTILSMYHSQVSKQDPIFDFVVAHFNEYAQIVGKEQVSGYVIGLNNSYIIQLCKKGDLAYKDRLGRVNRDLKEVYSGITFGSLSVLDAITLLSDATYYLYKQDERKFFENMDKYLAGMGDKAELEDYTQSLEDLSVAYNGNLSKTAYTKSIVWITKALEKEMSPQLRTRLLMMMGQCFQSIDNKEKAKQAYNQAFLVSAEISDKMQMKQIQETIQQCLLGL